MSVIEIINQKNSINLQFEEHKNQFVLAEQNISDALSNIQGDFVELLKLYNIENEDINRMKTMITSVADMCLLINYLINGNPKNVEDIYRMPRALRTAAPPVQARCARALANLRARTPLNPGCPLKQKPSPASYSLNDLKK